MISTQVKLRHLAAALADFPRDELREFAHNEGIKTGRDRKNTISNMITDGSTKAVLTLGGDPMDTLQRIQTEWSELNLYCTCGNTEGVACQICEITYLLKEALQHDHQ